MDILDVKRDSKILKKEDKLAFVKREKYNDETVDQILDFFIEFVLEVVGEK